MTPHRRLSAILLLLLPLTACGIPTTGITEIGSALQAPPAPKPGTANVRLYFLGPSGIGYVQRPVSTRLGPQQALERCCQVE